VNGNYEAAIILELRQYPATRLEGLEDRFLISIDHHNQRASFCARELDRPHATATAELVYCLGRAAGVKITAEIARVCYTGLMTDTGSFMFKGTNEHTFALARELRFGWGGSFSVRTEHLLRALYSEDALAGRKRFTNLHREGPLAWIW